MSLRCKLFGHQFYYPYLDENDYTITRYEHIDYCYRCGITKETINKIALDKITKEKK